jgi:outer membrane lipoprotein-sorting protein
MKTSITRTRRTFAIYVAMLGLLPVIAVAQTADDLVAKVLAARGGAEKIKGVRSQRVSGTISFGPGAEGPFTVEFVRPGKMHMDITIDGQTVVRVYDGKSAGWVINPFARDHNKDVQPMDGQDLENIADESDFDGPLVDYQSKGNHIELAGQDQVDGKPVNLLKLTNKNGDVRTYSFDATNNLPVKWQGKRKVDNQELDVVTFFSDYRDVDGLKFAFEVDSDTPGTQLMQKITIAKIELNADIDAQRFGKPQPAAPAPETPPPAKEPPVPAPTSSAPEPSPAPAPAPDQAPSTPPAPAPSPSPSTPPPSTPPPTAPEPSPPTPPPSTPPR